MTKQEIGAILLKLRETSGKSREEVADLLGKSVKTIGHWETGYAQPDANTLFLLCTIYGADLNESFGFAPASAKTAPALSAEALQMAADYERLDHWGKQLLQATADHELSRCDSQRISQSTLDREAIHAEVDRQLDLQEDTASPAINTSAS